MKGGQNLRELQQQRKDKEESDWVASRPCHVCKKVITGAYGWTLLQCGYVWSCSASCEREVARQRKEMFNVASVQRASGQETQGTAD